MKEYLFQNGIKLNYIKREGNISSCCIGFDAGAIVEEENELGLAHVVEHMVFKATKTRTENEINNLCDEVFGFNNAMTNYPYVIYYGTTSSLDFEEGFELFSDIILNPLFPIEGFKEEIEVILEELKEWKDEPYQECEDELFFNAFKNKRIKKLIIGTEKSIKSFNIDDVKRFYNEHYTPKNCVITVVSSLDFHEVLDVVNKYFGKWNREYSYEKKEIYETNKEGIFIKTRQDLNGAKIQYCFPLNNLTNSELDILKIFNFKFGEGTSSILYDEIRTKNGLAYDIGSTIKEERGIEVFKISLGTSKDKVDKAIDLVNTKIKDINSINGVFSEDNIIKILKSIDLKRELSIEKSIEKCKKLTTNSIMFNSTENILSTFTKYRNLTEDDILSVAYKILKNPTIQVLMP